MRPPRDQGAAKATWNYPEMQTLSRETLLKRTLGRERETCARISTQLWLREKMLKETSAEAEPARHAGHSKRRGAWAGAHERDPPCGSTSRPGSRGGRSAAAASRLHVHLHEHQTPAQDGGHSYSPRNAMPPALSPWEPSATVCRRRAATLPGHEAEAGAYHRAQQGVSGQHPGCPAWASWPGPRHVAQNTPPDPGPSTPPRDRGLASCD